jgi:hypothetical protein
VDIRLLFVAAVDNGAMNRVCKYLFETLVLISLDIYPEMGLLDHMAVLFLIL